MFRSVASRSRTHLRITTTTRTSLPLPETPPSGPSPSSPFSTHALRRNKQSGPGDRPPTNPEMPPFSLDGLGISKNMKMVLIGLICIFGTMETYTYYRWIKNWYYGESKESGAVKE